MSRPRASVAYLHDLEAKVAKAMSMRGARYIHLRALSARLGLASPADGQARPSGGRDRPVPAVRGRARRVTATRPIRRRVPVEEYLKPQRRFAHLFRDEAGQDDPAPSGDVRRQYPRLRPAAGRDGDRAMSLPPTAPFAITLEVGSSLENRTGSWRTERPVYVDRLPPCNDACPAGENIQAWLALAEEGDYEGAWRQIMEDNPLPGIMGRACYHPCESACNRKHIDSAVSIHAVERFLDDEARKQGWAPAPPAAETGARFWWSAPAPPASPPPTICAVSATPSPSTRPAPSPAA
jgi:hypothetical protein